MLYIDIILNELKAIILFEKYIFTVTFILFLVLFYTLYRIYFYKGLIYKLIIILRLLVLILLLPLINNKVFNKNIKSSRNQNINFIIDNSKSVGYLVSQDSTYYDNIFKKIDNWSGNKKLNLNWCTLDKKINSYDSIIYNKDNTSFSNIKNIFQKNESDQIIIFSDGNVNSNIITSDLFIPPNVKVHTIGVGNINDSMDIGIHNVTINNINDSTYLDVIFNVDVLEDVNFKFNIYSNEDLIYIDSISVTEGKYLHEKKIKINSKKLTNNIILDILPESFNDINQQNNKWTVKNPQPKQLNLLLISSALSYNTMFIKDVISQIDYTDIKHIYKHDNNAELSQLVIRDYDGIILDNFPNNQNDYDYLDEIYINDKPFMFIEAYDLNPVYIVNFLNDKLKSDLYVDRNFLNKSLFLNNEMKVSDISSSFNVYFNSMNNYFESSYYENNSIYEIRRNNFLALFIPNLSELSFLKGDNVIFQLVLTKKRDSFPLVRKKIN